MNDIGNIDDIKIFVDGFYQKVRKDDLLGLVFALKIASDALEKHLDRMYDFWNTVLFFERRYTRNPFSKYVDLPIESIHFNRCLDLFI
jgi:hemoglobin